MRALWCVCNTIRRARITCVTYFRRRSISTSHIAYRTRASRRDRAVTWLLAVRVFFPTALSVRSVKLLNLVEMSKRLGENHYRPLQGYIGLFISPSGISKLDCATTKTDTAERSILIGRETLQVFLVLGALAYFQIPPLGGSREEKRRSQ